MYIYIKLIFHIMLRNLKCKDTINVKTSEDALGLRLTKTISSNIYKLFFPDVLCFTLSVIISKNKNHNKIKWVGDQACGFILMDGV